MAINLDNIRGVTVAGKDIRQIIRPSDGKILWAGEHYINCANCGANASVKATHSSGREYPATADASGNATVTVYDDGNFTVTTTFQSQSKAVNVPATQESVSMRFAKYIFITGTGMLDGSSISRVWRTGSDTVSPTDYVVTNGAGYSTIGEWGNCYFPAIDVTDFNKMYMDAFGEGGGSLSYANNAGLEGASITQGIGARKVYEFDLAGITGSHRPMLHSECDHWGQGGSEHWTAWGKCYCYNLWFD